MLEQNLPDDALLGVVCLLTVRDMGMVDKGELEAALAEHGVTATVPSPSSPADAYRRATKEHEETEFVLENEHKVRYVLRDPDVNTSEFTTKLILREEVVGGATEHSLDWLGCGEIRFDRGKGKNGVPKVIRKNSGQVRYAEERAMLAQVYARVNDAYERYCQALDHKKIRSFILKHLRDLASIKLKDGVYFIPRARLDEVRSFREALEFLGTVTLDLLPLIDYEDQREIILRSYQDDTETRLRSLAEAIGTARKTPSQYARLLAQYEEITSQAREYITLLGDSVAQTTGAHNVVKSLLHRLGDAVVKGDIE